jgi:hypothetical protein
MSAGIQQHLDFLVKFQERQNLQGLMAPARFLLDHGRSYKLGPDSFKGRRMKIKECFRNAALQAMRHPELTYVEGYVEYIIPIEHAWLVDKTGRVIEPTLRRKTPVKDYFGVPVKTEYLIKTITRNKLYGVFDFWNWKHVLTDDPREIVAL